MAAILPTDFGNAINETPLDTAGAADFPIFSTGSKVFRLADAPAAGSNLANTPSYTVLSAGIKTANASADGSGVERILDQRLTVACDGVTATGVTGFMHTASPVGTTGSSISRPWFYKLKKNTTNEIISDVHQSQITDVAGWETYITAQITTIIA